MGKHLVEIFTNYTAFDDGTPVMDKRWNPTIGVEAQLLGRMLLEFEQVEKDALIGKLFFFESEPYASRGARRPRMMEFELWVNLGHFSGPVLYRYIKERLPGETAAH